MEAASSAKPRRGSPPIPPNYVSLRQLQELRLKEEEEEEKRRREAEEAAAAAAAMAKREAARKAEMEAIAAAAAAKREHAARKPETRVSAVVPVVPVRAKERRDGGVGPQWVAVKGRAHAPRVGGRPEGKAKVSAAASAQTRAADEPGQPVEEASSHGGKVEENKGERKGKGKAKMASSGEEAADPGSIGGGSGESAGAPSRRGKSRKWKKGAGGGGASAEPSAESASAKTADASPPQGVKPENAGKPKSPELKRADASPGSNSSRGKKADAAPAPPSSAAEGVVGELRMTAEIKPEGLVEGHRRPPAVEVQGAAEQKPRVVRRRAWPRLPGDRCKGAEEGRVWVPKAAATGCAEL
ncbi:hypothetical protein PR202_ga13099 [Eleusine coracana subsp. coracana]|uniref:Uncharacterized protein n=1 Tax=Eleusine coracana subsp. coracana TaxID=191504 RepID=A0AAV5CDC7_ELECO|nr:hypothetical protein PR202_ga13099 [Eleusine coracana subsp. coracana]